MDFSCKTAHVIAHFDSGFISKNLLHDFFGNQYIGFARALCFELCDLPGENGLLHCHCSDPFSLTCQSRAVVLNYLCSKRLNFKNLRTPYFFCCSRFVIFRVNDTCFVKCRWKYCRIAMDVLSEMNICYKYYLLGSSMFSLLEFNSEAHVSSIITTLLHQRINLDPSDPSGYHIGTWEGWKECKPNLYEGRYCRLRFIDFKGLTAQERFLRNKFKSQKTIRTFSFPPPTRLSDGKWRCYYRYNYCSCCRSCTCDTSYQYIDLEFRSIFKYTVDLMRTPHDLKEYCQFYASVFN